MNAKKVYLALIGSLVVVGLIGLTAIIVGNKMLESKSTNLVNLRLKQQTLVNQQIALTQAKQDVIKYTPLNNIAQTVVPQEKNQALAVREITAFASAANINIASVTFPASTLGTTTPTDSSSKDQPPPNPAHSQLQPAKGLKGIFVMPITIQSDSSSPVSFSQLVSFLQALENNRHTAEVNQLTITPSDTNGQHLSFTIVLNIYVK